MLCDRGIIMRNGKIVEEGNIKSIINNYLISDSNSKEIYVNHIKNHDGLIIKSISVVDSTTEDLKIQFFQDERITIKFKISGNLISFNKYTLFCTVKNMQDVKIFSSESRVLDTKELLLTIPPNTLVRGDYHIEAFIHIPNVIAIDRVDNVCGFSIIDRGSNLRIHGGYDYGLVFVNSQWHYRN
jgi:lipopolysaccharide transport system ATP-binding protein